MTHDIDMVCLSVMCVCLSVCLSLSVSHVVIVSKTNIHRQNFFTASGLGIILVFLPEPALENCNDNTSTSR